MYFEGFRAEEFVYQKLDKPKPPRLTESEALGQSMIEAGNDFGPGTSYGTLHGLWCFTLKKKKKSKQTNNHKFEISAVFWTKKHLYIEGLSLETLALGTL